MRLRALSSLAFFLGILSSSFFACRPTDAVFAANMTGGYKYAWSNNVGYINFENVAVADGALSGYAWSKNAGWMRFDPLNGGVSNNNGDLSGYAWGEQLGWINFNNVSINTATGKFSGTATGDLVGTLTFDCPTYCDVRTDWRPACPTVANTATYNSYPTCGPATCNSGYTISSGACVVIGGGGGGSLNPPITPIPPLEPDSPPGQEPETSSEPTGNTTEPDSKTPTNATTRNNHDVLESEQISDVSRPIADNITHFFEDLGKQLPPLQAEESRQESFNAPLTVEPEQAGLLVWDFTTPEMTRESKRQAVIIELPREIAAEALTITVNLTTPELVVRREQATLLGAVFSVIAMNRQNEEIHKFNQPIKITLIIPEDLRGRKDLGVYSLSDKADSWSPVADAVFDEISASFYVDHLTHFAIFAAKDDPQEAPSHFLAACSSFWIYIIAALILFWFFYRRKKKTRT